MAEAISAKVAWALSKAIRGVSKDKSNGRTVKSATVVRKDSDGTVWVRMAGSDIETPINGGIAANVDVGDSVLCRIDGTALSLTGNTTDPAVGMARATGITERIVERARATLEAGIGSAQSAAEAAARVANAVNQHFWSDTNGIHVTESTREDWADSQTGPNVLINSLGQLFRDGLNNLLSMLPAQTVTDTFEGDGSTVAFTLSSTPTSMVSVSIDDVETTAYTVSSGSILFESAPSAGAAISVMYRTNETVIAIWDGLSNEASSILASFGKVIRIGRATESSMELDYHSMKLTDREGYTYFHVSDLRSTDGSKFVADVRDRFTADGRQTFYLTYVATPWHTEGSLTNDDATVMVDGSEVTSGWTIQSETSYLKLVSLVQFDTAPSVGSVITIDYKTESRLAKAYTLGIREPNGIVGAFSTAEGYEVEASGNYSHVEGNGSKANGSVSHAEGSFTTASGEASHAEGSNTEASHASHAEGLRTTASGFISHAEGDSTTASGEASHAEGASTEAGGHASHAEGFATTASASYSHAQNRGTVTAFKDQTAIGTFNDNQEANAFEVGNGVSENDRSNAFAVDWTGVVDCGGIAPKWVTIDPATLFTSMNSGWANDTSYTQLAYSPTLHRMAGRIRINSTAAHSAGNNVVGVIASDYRPYIRALCDTTTTNAYKMYIDANGNATIALSSATTASTTGFYFVADYTIA